MKNKILSIFGPLVLSAFLLLIFFFSPWKINVDDPKIIKEASTSMTSNILRGNMIKNVAMAEKEYVPFFGSSELNRVNSLHPSVLAEKYDRGYTPFLLGAPGTQSLTQLSMIHSMASELQNKKAVFIISPQWFVPDGVTKDYFNHLYSEQQVFSWLLNLTEVTTANQYYAGRLLSFSSVRNDETASKALESVKDGLLPSTDQKTWLQMQENILSREDQLFSWIGLGKNLQSEINQAAKALPEDYNFEALNTLAKSEGERQTTNNSFGIQNSFYSKRLKKSLASMKGSQKSLDYRYSPEYSDFQLVLEEFAKNNVDVLFIIPPVNAKWMAYTGLSEEMLEGFDRKIRYQLESQGFTNIADLSKEGNVDYFMEDTIHIGWVGWLAADQYIKLFLAESNEGKANYKIDDQTFVTKEWQQKPPDEILTSTGK